MELFATIRNSRNLQRASSDGLTTNRQYLYGASATRPSLQVKYRSQRLNDHLLFFKGTLMQICKSLYMFMFI